MLNFFAGSPAGQRHPRVVAILFGLIFLACAATGYKIFRQLVEGEVQQARTVLTHIADLQTSALSAWVKERLSDAKILSSSGFLGETADLWLARSGADDKAMLRMREELRAIKNTYHYREAGILDEQGNTLISTSDNMIPIDDYTRALIQRALATRTPQISSIRPLSGAGSGDRVADVVAPLLDMHGQARPPRPLLFLRTDANLQLRRFAQSSPLLHAHTDAQLVEIRGDRVVSLTDDGRPGFQYLDVLPIDPKTLLDAVRTPMHTFSMNDVQGGNLIAVAREVAETPWFLITMVDEQPIRGAIYRQGWIVAGFCAAFLLLTGAAMLLWWKRKESELRLATLQTSTEKKLLERQYNYLSKYANDMIVLADADGRIIEVNDRALQVSGLDREEIIGASITSLPTSPGAPSWEELLSRLRHQGAMLYEVVLPQLDGTSMPIEVNARVINLEGKQYIQLIGRDITERKESEAALQESRERLDAILQSLLDVVWSFSPDLTRLNYINRSVEDVYGYPISAFMKYPKLWLDAVHPENRGNVENTLRSLTPEQPLCDAEYRIVRRDGKLRWVHCRGRLVVDGKGNPLRIDGVTTDVTQRKSAELQVQFLAYYDSLTLLPNRALLNDRLAQATHIALRNAKKVAVLFMDLDNFKNINDSLGHHVGDMLLRAIAERLLHCVREEDTVARLGGDEFVVVLPDIERGEQAISVAEKILASTSRPFVVQGQEIHSTISIGISIYPDDAMETHELIRHADSALYQAKAEGRNGYQFFTQELNYQIVRSSTIERQLRQAIESGDLCLWYQPQVDTGNGKMVGAEALLRWRHRDSFLSPVEFIPVAEERGLIGTIGEWAMREACRQCRLWQAQGLSPVPIAVNVSPIQFQQEGFANLVADILRESELDPCYLELEITESSIMRRAPLVAELAMQLRDTGVGISIDDFGTGYSSLSYLKQIPIDKIKIDRSFIFDMLNDIDDEAITSAIISLAHSLKLRVIAEGVESREQLERLRFLGCDEVQGYYYSCPVSAEKFREFLANDKMFCEVQPQK